MNESYQHCRQQKSAGNEYVNVPTQPVRLNIQLLYINLKLHI